MARLGLMAERAPMAKRGWAWLGLAGALGWPMTAGAQPPPAGSGQDAGGLDAGGLAPPGGGAADPIAPPPPTERDLAAAEARDSGRGLQMFWLDAEAGFTLLGLQTFKADGLVDPAVVETQQGGLMLGGGLGVRLVFITLGPRFRFGTFGEWQVWTLDGEVGLRIPFGKVEPYFLLSGGYASVGALDVHDRVDSGDVDIRGWNLRAGGGADLYLSRAFSLGGRVTGDALFLRRPGVEPDALGQVDPGAAAARLQAVYGKDGASIGAALTASAVVGLHF